MDNIVKTASEYVTDLFNKNLPSVYTYHNLRHTQEVFDAATELGEGSSVSSEELEIIQIAAWFHDTGFTKDYQDHENKSVEIVKEFLESAYYNGNKIRRITDIIKVTKKGNVPESLSGKIIRDSDIIHISKEDFYPRSLSLKAEWEYIDGKKFTESEWMQSSLEFIKRTLFYTDYARLKYEKGREKNILRLTELVKLTQS
ncbi:MAG: HD domain-containing protein [Ignavibacteriaceae bacterium]|nr:HD domain-containing protein [Ignavibacteriaceae bacterium]